MPAKNVETLIFEFKIKDDASKGFDTWEKRLKSISKIVAKFAKDFKVIDKAVLAFSKAAARHSGDMAKIWIQNFGKIGTEGIKAFTKLTSESLKSVNTLIKGAGALFKGFVGTITGGIIPGLQLFGKAISALLSPIKAVAKALSTLFIKASEEIGEFVSNTVRAFSTFEDALIVARRTMGLTADATTELGEDLQNLSVSVLKGGVASSELARIAGIAGTLGIKARDDVLAFTEVIAKMSVATNLTAQAAAQALPKLLKAWDLPIAANIKGLGSVINQLGNDFNVTQSEIVDSMTRMMQASSGFKLTIDQAAALSATMIDAGLRTRVSATAMSRVMDNLKTDHTKFAEVLSINSAVLKQAILSNDPTEALNMVFLAFQKIAEAPEGVIRSAQALKDLGFTGQGVKETFLAMAKNLDTFDIALKNASDEIIRQTSLDKEFDVAMTTLTKSWQAFKNVLDAISQVIGKPLAEALARILNRDLTPLLTQFFTWLTTSEKLQVFYQRFIQILEEGFSQTVLEVSEFIKGLTKSEDLMTGIQKIALSFMTFLEQGFKSLNERLGLFFFDLATAGPWEAFKKLALSAWETIKTAARNVWEFISNQIDKALQGADESTKKWVKRFQELPETLESLISDVKIFITFVKELRDEWSGVIKILKVAAKIIKALTFDARTDDPVLQGLQRIDEENKKIRNSTRAAGQEVEKLHDEYNKMGEDVTGNSVLPDIDTWTKLTTSSIGVMTQAVNTTKTAFDKVAAVNLDAINQQIASVHSFLKEGSTFATAQSITQASRLSQQLGGQQFQAQIAARRAQTTPIPDTTAQQRVSRKSNATEGGFQTPAQPMTLEANLILDDMVIGKVAKRLTDEQNTQAERITTG